ncbi:hypothetical protein B2J73_00810 [Stutzerimonas stutzeri]|nr:hypothetical protein B2J73_00810 [Stutzerimonas stutzeri]
MRFDAGFTAMKLAIIGLLCIRDSVVLRLEAFDLIVILCGVLAVVELSRGFLVFFGLLSYKLFFQ